MKANRRSFAQVILGIFLCAVVVAPGVKAQVKYQIKTQTPARPIVLKGARLIDGTGRPAIENSVLVIEGDRVVAAGKAGSGLHSQGRRCAGRQRKNDHARAHQPPRPPGIVHKWRRFRGRTLHAGKCSQSAQQISFLRSGDGRVPRTGRR